MTTTFLPETTIRYVEDNLGLIGDPAVVHAGDLGRVLGPAPEEGWIFTEPYGHPGKVCPVWHSGMIEKAEDAS